MFRPLVAKRARESWVSVQTMTLPRVTVGMTEAHPEQALIDGLRAGENAAFRELFRTYSDEIFRLGRQFVHSDAEADEVVQEVFISAFRYIDRFRGHARLKTWLYRITVNRALKRRRWWRRRREVPEEPVSHRFEKGISPAERAGARQELAIVERCLEQLEIRKRTVLILHEIEGLDTRRIAEVMQCPRSTVLTRLSRARHELLKLAQQQGVRTPEEVSS